MIVTEPSELNDFLNKDERLLWTGNPKGGIIFRKSDIFIIPFTLLWLSFAIFWMITASKAGIFFSLFGVPFVLIGFIMAFGRFLIDKKQREKTLYGITKDRIIIRSGIFSRKLESINIKMLTNLEFTEKSDGSGSIRLGPKDPRDPFGMMGGMNWWPGVKTTPGVNEILNVREVYTLITDLQQR